MTAQQRLEALLAKIEAAEHDVRHDRPVDMRPLDAESLAIHKQLKGRPDPAIQPVLARTITALERLTRALEDRLETLKSPTR